MVDLGWQWDPSLYAGSARYWFERATGLDADADMLAAGARQAALQGVPNVTWLHRRAEDLPRDLPPFRVVTLAQSFHWMDRARVAQVLHDVLEPGGALVHVHATTHEGISSEAALPLPRAPRAEIGSLIGAFLGSRRRAGQGTLPPPPESEDEVGRVEARIYGAAGFHGPSRIVTPGAVVTRTADEVVASVFSLSSAAPHLFGSRIDEFEAALRSLLASVSPQGRFSEQLRESATDIWRVG